MFKFFFRKADEPKQHILKERLLMLVDGELSSKEAARAREHLETCWNCRTDLEMVEETISEFMDFRKKVQLPLAPPPPKNWGGFSSSIESIKSDFDGGRKSRFRLSSASPFQLRLGVVSVCVLLIGILIIQLMVVRPISARDLLDRVQDHQSQKLAATTQPVVYQKFLARVGDGKELNWEIWFDATRPRVKRSSGAGPRELADLHSALEQNRMDANRPLSAESFRAWHDSLPLKSDEVIDGDTIILKTINSGNTKDGQIRQATVKFRSSDYHPLESTFVLSTQAGDSVVTITEVAFEIMSLAKLGPHFFDGATELPKLATSQQGNSPELALDTNTNSVTAPSESSPATLATADLEVEVLRLLSSAGADLGDEINVNRENGFVLIRGLVESQTRKNEILSALQSVRQNPAIRIDLDTVADALAKKKQPGGTPTSVENLETDSLESAVENELTQRFGSEAEARRFSSRVVNRSGQAMSRVYALRKLARQFTAAEIKTLSPEARSKWLALIRSHATAFSSDCDALSRDIGNAFGASSASGSAGAAVTSADDVARAVESLFQLASANDRAIRSAFTISTGGAKFSALKSDQFWRSLRSADSLASRIAAIK